MKRVCHLETRLLPDGYRVHLFQTNNAPGQQAPLYRWVIRGPYGERIQSWSSSNRVRAKILFKSLKG